MVAGFDDEWSRYASVGSEEHARVFELYFDQVDAAVFNERAVALDASRQRSAGLVAYSANGPARAISRS